MFLGNAANASRNIPETTPLTFSHFSSLVLFSRYPIRGIANLLNANEVGMKIFEDYANSWDWILV